MTAIDRTNLSIALGFLGAAISATEAAIDKIDDTRYFGYCDNLEGALSIIDIVQRKIYRAIEPKEDVK